MPMTKWIYHQASSCFFSKKQDYLFNPEKDLINDNRYQNNKNKFYKKIKNIIWSLREDHDRNNFIGNGNNFSPMSQLYSTYTQFLHEANGLISEINSISSEKMAVFDDEFEICIEKRDYKKWFEINNEFLTKLLNRLSEIYSRRTPCAKLKDILWEVLDVLIWTCLIAGISFAFIKMSPVIAIWVSLSEIAKICVAVGDIVIGFLSSILYKIFNDENAQITHALHEDVKMKFGI